MLTCRAEKRKAKGNRMMCIYCKMAIPQNHDNWVSSPTPGGGTMYAHNKCLKIAERKKKKKTEEATT